MFLEKTFYSQITIRKHDNDGVASMSSDIFKKAEK
jgi:hypothetical protein